MTNYNHQQDLIQLAYRYYPYDVLDDGSSAYVDSKEHQYLKKERENVNFLFENWNELLISINSKFPEKTYEIEDWIEMIPRDHCFIGRLIIFKDDRNNLPDVLTFNVSFIAPLFSVYVKKGIPSFLIPDYLHATYISLRNLIAKDFPDHQELLPELAPVEIDGISYDGVGKTKETQDILFLKKMTIFNAFFSTSYF